VSGSGDQGEQGLLVLEIMFMLMTKLGNKKLKYRPSAILMPCLVALTIFSATNLIGAAQATTCPNHGSSNCHVTVQEGGGAEYKGMKGIWTVTDPSGTGGTVGNTSWMIKIINGNFYELGWIKYMSPPNQHKYYWAKQIGGVFSGPFFIADTTVGAVKTYQIDDLNQDSKWTMTVSGYSPITDTVQVSWNVGEPQAGGESTIAENSMPKNDFNNMKYWGGSPEQWRAWVWPVGYVVEDSYWLSFCNYDHFTIGKAPPAGCP
jgi:hypothetical protein